MATREEAAARVDALAAQLGEPSAYSYFIPNWETVDAKQGLWWMRSQLWEGFYVAHRVDVTMKRVYFKCWEFGDEEPTWESQRYAT